MKLTHAVKKRAKAISRAVTMRYRNKQGLHFRESLFFAKKKKIHWHTTILSRLKGKDTANKHCQSVSC